MKRLRGNLCPICRVRKVKSVAFCNLCWRDAQTLPLEFLPKNYRCNMARVEMYRKQMLDSKKLVYLER